MGYPPVSTSLSLSFQLQFKPRVVIIFRLYDISMANNRYTFFNPKLRDKSYRLGDAYDDNTFDEFRSQWQISHE